MAFEKEEQKPVEAENSQKLRPSYNTESDDTGAEDSSNSNNRDYV